MPAPALPTPATVHQIQFPPWYQTLIYIGAAILCSQLTMYLDRARAMAYIVLPYALYTHWLRQTNIRWNTFPRTTSLTLGLGIAWLILGFTILVEIISIEQHDPLIGQGMLYTVSAWIAGQ